MNTVRPEKHDAHAAPAGKRAASGMFMVDHNGCFTHVSDTLNALLGYGHGDLTGRAFTGVVYQHETGAQLSDTLQMMHFKRGSAAPLNIELIHKNGSRIAAVLRSAMLSDASGRMTGAIGFVVLESKGDRGPEKKFWETKQNLECILAHSADGIVVLNDRGRFTLCNEAFLKMVDYREADIVGKHVFDVTPPVGKCTTVTNAQVDITADYTDRQVQKAQELFEKGSLTYRHYYRRSDGRLIPVEATYSLLYDEQGVRNGTTGIIRDVSARMKAEQEVEESKDFLENVFKTAADGIIVTDQWGTIVKANEAVEKMLQRDIREILGKHPYEFVPVNGQQNGVFRDKLKQMYFSLEDREFVENFETVFEKSSRELCPVDLNIRLMRDKDGNITGSVLSLRDITERRQIEQQLVKSRRVEAITSLARGIANDFNKILTDVLGSVARAHTADSQEQLSDSLEQAEQATLRAKDLSNQLLAFSAESSLDLQQTSVEEIIRSAAAQALRVSQVACEFVFESALWPVMIDKTLIEQVFRSLFYNCENAMPEGGTIRVMAENYVHEDDGRGMLGSGRYVKICIQDQGISILNEYLQNIFDPYFMKNRKGSGFVLTMAYSMIKRHNGLISVESEIGSGSTFYIYLPTQVNAATGA